MNLLEKDRVICEIKTADTLRTVQTTQDIVISSNYKWMEKDIENPTYSTEYLSDKQLEMPEEMLKNIKMQDDFRELF